MNVRTNLWLHKRKYALVYVFIHIHTYVYPGQHVKFQPHADRQTFFAVKVATAVKFLGGNLLPNVHFKMPELTLC